MRHARISNHTEGRMNPVFVVLAVAAAVSAANIRLFDSLLPTIAEDFAVAPTVASVVVTSFTLAYGLFQIVHGPLGDRVGRLRTVAIAMSIACVGSLGSAIAPTLPALTILRFVTGIGAAGVIPVSIAWLADNTPYETRQATLGRFIGFILMGQILGPALGGALAEWLSWREVFFLFTAVFLIVSIVLFRVDYTSRRNPDPDHELRPQRSNVLQTYLEILRDPWVRTVLLTVAIEGTLFYGTFAYIGAWLKEKFDLSYLLIGATLAGFGLGGVIYSLLVKWLLKRLHETSFVITGVSILLVFFLCLPFSPTWQVVGPLCVIGGFGFYMLHNTLQTKATDMWPAARGTAISTFALCLFCGQALGVALLGKAITAFGYDWTFVATGVALLLLGIRFAWRLR
jgi:predicted MFS family arabinose efflux permease